MTAVLTVVRLEPDAGARAKLQFCARKTTASWGVTLTDGGNTRISGRILDQAALHGVLKRIRDLGMTILSVYRINNGDKDE